MRAGRLRHRVVIQQPVNAADATGQMVATWTTVGTVWAAVEPLNGREYMTAQQVDSETTTRIRTRYGSEISSIDPSWRITFDSRNFDIQSVIRPNEYGDELVIMAGEGLNNG